MWAKLKDKIWQWRGVLIAAPSVAGLVIAMRMAGFLQMLELAALDQFFLARPREPVDERIVIVELNESDIEYVGDWPMSDTVLATLLNNIKAQKPRAIGLDLYRDLPREPGHKALVNLYKTTPNLIGIQKVVSDPNSKSVNPPPELKQQNQIGANDVIIDPDGKIRRALLFLASQDETIFSLGWQLSTLYLQAEKINPQLVPGTEDIKWGKALFSRFTPNDGGYVRTDNNGYQLLLNFHGPARRSFRMVSMTDVLQNKVTGLGDRIVIIGPTAESLKDLFYSPYSSGLIGIPERMAGVEIHANLTSQILTSVLDGRPTIKTWSEPLEWVWILVISILGATLTWTQRSNANTGKGIAIQIGSIFIVGISIVGGSYIAFLYGWWIPIVPPLTALAGSALAIVSYIAKTAGDIRKTFGRYLTAEVVSNLLETPEGLKLGGERKKVTIMMTDLRGFSAVSERLAPEIVVSFLNIYLGAMAEIISQYNGTIDEFIGDAILVIFGAPTKREDDAERAVACAVAMQRGMDAVNEQIKQKEFDMPKLEMGIGINTGEVVVGNIGSDKRAKYGVVGSHVNLTGRIESYTVGGQILISEYTYKEAGDVFKVNGQMQVEPKGIKQPITLYDIGGVTGKYDILMPESQDNLLPLKQEIPLQYTVLDGKHVIGTMKTGTLIKLSETGAELNAEEQLDPLSNIKINLLARKDTNESAGDLYAKVIAKNCENKTTCYIRFTAIPPDVAAMLSEALGKSNS